MHKIAFLFPGQGAQKPGMGRDFFENFSEAREVFEEADHLLNRNLSSIVFEGPAERLIETRNSQVAIFVTSMAIERVIQKQFAELRPMLCAGHSVGEYAALTAAEMLSFQEAVTLVQARGDFMNEACEQTRGTMAAVIGLDGESVQQVIRDLAMPHDVWAANFNCPGQVVISTTEAGLAAATLALKTRGARRILHLQVHGAFHSPLMQDAEEQLARKIDEVTFSKSDASVVMNVSGEVVSDVDEARKLLKRQMTSPVLWEQGVRMMMQEGIELFVEIGPGKVLSGLNKRIEKTLNTMNVEKVEDLDVLAKAFEQKGVKN